VGYVVGIDVGSRTVKAVLPGVVVDDARLVETHAHAVDGVLLVENRGFMSGAGTRWWASVQGVDQGEIFTRAALAPAGSDGVRFLPTPSGSSGAFAGLSFRHGAAHLARAVLEGCAFGLRDVLDRFTALGLGGEEVRVVGAGARSALWLQIKADVTGRTMRPVLGDCATTGGAAMLAAVGAGAADDLGQAAELMVRVADAPVVPDRATAGVCAEAYASYRRLREASPAEER
jgi:xylulokinase